MRSLTFGLFTQVSGSGPLGPLVRKTLLYKFLCPHHEMGEERIESYLSVFVCLCYPELCPAHNFVLHGGI